MECQQGLERCSVEGKNDTLKPEPLNFPRTSDPKIDSLTAMSHDLAACLRVLVECLVEGRNTAPVGG